MTLIQITGTINIDESEIKEDFVRTSGPGGQNVNKVATTVQLRFDVANSQSLPEEVRQRLISLAGNRITSDGILIIEARRFRTQKRNREDAIDRLVELIHDAAQRPNIRRQTKPTAASKVRRLESKRHRAENKRKRGLVDPDKE
jgi:ribosome-associated protein